MSAHVVCFRIGQETYGVDIFAVREIVRPPGITAVPGSPGYVLGIINLRGKIISVVDLAQRLGVGVSRLDRASRILVVELHGFTMGFLVDAATEVMKLDKESFEPAPHELRSALHGDYLDGLGKLEDRLIIVINLRHLLSEEGAADVAATAMNGGDGAR